MNTKECQVCFNQISIKAKKCQFCLEWQDSLDDSSHPIEEPALQKFDQKFSKVNIPFQKSLVNALPLPNFASIFIIVAILFVSIQSSWYILDEDRIYLLSFLAFSVQLIFSWAGIIWIYSVLKKNYDSFIKISSSPLSERFKNFEKAFNRMFGKSYSIWVGIIVGLIASVGDYIVGTPFKSMEAKIMFAVFEFINMFFAGAAISSMLMFATYLNHLKVESKNKFLNLEKSLSIKNIGSIHLKTSLLAVVPLFLGVIAKLFGDWSWDLLIVLWYVVFAILIIIYVFWPIQNIHELMVDDIDAQTQKIAYKIEKVLDDINHNPSSRNFRKLNELREWESSISSQNTWPFNHKGVWAVFLAVIFPIVMMLVDRIWTS